ncbi:ribonuclease H-like domain-containing protein [Sphingomonas sp. S6]|jgi:predicted PolB exonuclease-like 3'-5' exonuclease|uniref:ribonuclease H-like domain-containing protein n=1 Tax=Sphingomonas sp. S6 TaxID=3368600 RepID=UPI000FB6F476|nr:ribonuclease H-like domain-containing protein [uncultured Sphingomonas sp.]RTL21723.1 MAG: hypothetical protein EKK50_02925 [Sphingomonadaceae bacterium]
MKTLVLDIETRPDAAACARAGADPAAGFPPFPLHEILCVSILEIVRSGWNEHTYAINTYSRLDLSERGIIEAVEEHVSDAQCVVTYNGRGFDVPVVIARAALCGLVVPAINTLAIRVTGRHEDLLDEVCFNRAAPRPPLSALCGAFNIPVKIEAHGGNVTALAEAGDLARVTRYCETDVVATYLARCMWRSTQVRGTGIEDWNRLAAWIRSDQPHLAHLLPYATPPRGGGGGACLTPAHLRNCDL